VVDSHDLTQTALDKDEVNSATYIRNQPYSAAPFPMTMGEL